MREDVRMDGTRVEKSIELRRRSKAFALRVIKLAEALPRKSAADVIGRQILRSATSVAANYRAAQRARSKAEFISKISIVVEEMDETVFWIEMIIDSGLLPVQRVDDLLKEANELLAIFAASQWTARNAGSVAR